MCTVLLPLGVNPIALNKIYHISYDNSLRAEDPKLSDKCQPKVD